MSNSSIVIDAVVHAYDHRPSNRAAECAPGQYDRTMRWVHDFGHRSYESLEPGYMLDYEDWAVKGFAAESLASVCFEESDLDMVAYHGVLIPSVWREGVSPWRPGLELKRAYPNRVLLYAPVNPLDGERALEQMQAQAEAAALSGFKIYSDIVAVDPITRRHTYLSFDDPERLFPFYARSLELGINHIAVHKLWPIGPGSLEKERVEDISEAAVAFPELTFEVVHSGWAFLEECALQLVFNENVWANLESVAGWVVRRPTRFAHVIGTMLQLAGPDRILFATGAAMQHPQPVIDAFRSFEMPEDLRAGYGYPPITEEVRAKLLGGNMARLHEINVQERLDELRQDQWAARRHEYLKLGEQKPWRVHLGHHDV